MVQMSIQTYTPSSSNASWGSLRLDPINLLFVVMQFVIDKSMILIYNVHTDCTTLYLQCTFKSDCQGLTLTSLLTPTVDTTYCDVVLIACPKPCLTLCNTGTAGVQKSSIWRLGIIGGNVDEVEISTVSTTQCPAHSDTHSSLAILREVGTGEVGERGDAIRYHTQQ